MNILERDVLDIEDIDFVINPDRTPGNAWFSLPPDDEGKIRCLVCAHRCLISEGKAGICGIRKNEDKVLKLYGYGKSATRAIDPIEKKPLAHFHPGQGILSLSCYGCNFGCTFCQNYTLSMAIKEGVDVEELEDNMQDMPPDMVVRLCKMKNVRFIAGTYNEPTISFEYYYDVARLAKEQGIEFVFVTNGYMTREALIYMAPYIAAMNIDLKAFSEEFYRKICKARLSPVLSTIQLAHLLGIHVEVTTLVIPGENDDDIEGICDFVASVSNDLVLHLSAFHPDYRMTNRGRTTPKLLRDCKTIAVEKGLRFVYLGNTKSDDSIYCPECSTVVIEKRGYVVTRVNVESDGLCPTCKCRIYGRF
ncbi:hypothetical protein PCE1_001117 [Barthelona sp. PCE]